MFLKTVKNHLFQKQGSLYLHLLKKQDKFIFKSYKTNIIHSHG